MSIAPHRPGRTASRRLVSSFAFSCFLAAYASPFSPCQLSIQSDVNACTTCLPAGATLGSMREGMLKNSRPKGSCSFAQSSRIMWCTSMTWSSVCGNTEASTPMCREKKEGARLYRVLKSVSLLDMFSSPTMRSKVSHLVAFDIKALALNSLPSVSFTPTAFRVPPTSSVIMFLTCAPYTTAPPCSTNPSARACGILPTPPRG
mmetsp:Transcript_25151/g.68371  ORF Transcript_25151/g.68371 Transcript_25151/m.68371 type:complete len:203 (-) Transcript_25151:832-1440(-)